MAYVVTTYFCETCGRQHDKIEYAEKCESLHLHPKSFSKPNFKHGDKAPDSIVITCESVTGKKQNITYYKRKESEVYQWP